ncbi:MAG: transporter substrate-binding domain-containing protein [Alkalimonas sp.]|nr:transporter substrate-binding domain-containing protein [Alkalimonas sp.]
MAANATLTWCLGHLPNRVQYESGKAPSGPEVDLMQDFAARVGMTLEYTVPTPIPRCLQQLQRGQVDIVAGLLFTAERNELFYMLPYDTARPESWFIHKDNPIEQKSNLRLTFVDGRIYSANLREHYAAAGYQLLNADNLDDGLAMLLLQETDVLIGPEHITLGRIAANPRYHHYLILAPQDSQPNFEVHIAISRTGRYADQKTLFQQALEQMRAEGRHRLYE